MKSIASNGPLDEYKFIGEKFFDRSANNPSSWSIGLKAEIYLLARGVYCFWSRSVRELIKEAKSADVIVFHGVPHPKLITAARKLCKKIIFMAHSPTPWCDEYLMDYSTQKRSVFKGRYYYYEWAERLAFACSDTIVFPSIGAMNCYASRYSDLLKWKEVKFIPSGVDIDVDEELLNKSHQPKEKIIISYVGRFNMHKGFDIFCNVAKELNSPSLEFRCAGGGEVPDERYVKNLGWSNNVAEIFLSSDIILVPNRVAYYDLMPIEAAAFGLPLVFSPVGGNIDQANAFPDSILADSCEVSAVSIALKKAVEIKKENPNFGMRNRDVFNSYFTSVEFGRRWIEMVNSVLK